MCEYFVFLAHTSSSGLTSRTALSCSFVPTNTITQFGLQSWFSRDKLGESKQDDEGQEGRGRVKVKEKERRRVGREGRMNEAKTRRKRDKERMRGVKGKRENSMCD